MENNPVALYPWAIRICELAVVFRTGSLLCRPDFP